MDDPNCVLCRIAGKEIPAEIWLENESGLAILDIHPKAPGHTMVIPRLHTPSLVELPPEAVGPLFLLVQKAAEKLVRVMRADGLTIGVNQGEVSGQTVPHLHIHLFPRYKDDHGGSVHSIVDNPPREDIAETAKKLRI